MLGSSKLLGCIERPTENEWSEQWLSRDRHAKEGEEAAASLKEKDCSFRRRHRRLNHIVPHLGAIRMRRYLEPWRAQV